MPREAEIAEREDILDAFTTSLDELDVPWTRCARPGLPAALETVVEPPAVGVALPFAEGLLEEAGVQLDPAPDPLRAARTGVTAIALGIADYGSVVIQHGGGAEAVSLFPGLHVAVLRAEDVVAGVPEALARLGEAIRTGQGSFVVVTGPSATAGMGALVRGAHGPREVHVILLDPDEDAP